MNTILETSRLTIKRTKREDAEFCLDIWLDEEMGRYLADPPKDLADDTYKEWKETVEIYDGCYYFVAVCKETNERVGTCSVVPNLESQVWDLGYCVHRHFWRKGYATEMILALIHFSIQNGAMKITASVAKDNKPSCSVLHKLGFIVEDEGVFKKGGTDIYYDKNIYALTRDMVMDSLAIEPMKELDFDVTTHFVDEAEADADFLVSYNKKSSDVHAIRLKGRIVGLAQVEMGQDAYVYIYMDKAYRRLGIGSKALKCCEGKLPREAFRSSTCYRDDHQYARAFARKNGYHRKFASTIMRYEGPLFTLPDLDIREYQDEDYDETHSLYAVAFHNMRVSTGDFPDSEVEKPSDDMRAFWTKTSSDRFVYRHDGEIVGYAHLVGHEISSVSIGSKDHGKGYGTYFVKYLCNTILKAGHPWVELYCVVGNKAKRLYDALGFKELSTVEFAVKSIDCAASSEI